jgi:hypothetical protein
MDRDRLLGGRNYAVVFLVFLIPAWWVKRSSTTVSAHSYLDRLLDADSRREERRIRTSLHDFKLMPKDEVIEGCRSGVVASVWCARLSSGWHHCHGNKGDAIHMGGEWV